MSLTCYEHDDRASHFLTVHTGVFCVTTAASSMFTAVCELIVNTIPDAERSSTTIEGGIDIHAGSSTLNLRPELSDNLSYRGFRLGERLFSISRETAQRYLPRTAALY